MKKVIHINDVANVGSTLVQGLVDRGIDAELMNLKKRPNSGLLRLFWPLFLPFVRLVEYFRLRVIEKREDISIIHLHYVLHSYLLLGTKTPYHLHIHGSDIRDVPTSSILFRLAKKIARSAEKVYYSTPDLKSHSKRVRDDCIFVPNPVNKMFFNYQPTESMNNFPEIDILCISRVAKFKGIEVCLKAIEDTWSEHPNLKVAIFNYGNTMYMAEDFINKYKDVGNLIMLNKIPHEKMPQLISSSKIVLGQMELGVLGCSELEAMVCGIPVVCKFTHWEVYDEPPPVLQANTPNEVSNQVSRLIEDPNLRRVIGNKAKEWVIKYHGIENVVSKFINYYEGTI
ncbi:glycosyltransferase family 4 protein [Patescibacteria group bacterium]